MKKVTISLFIVGTVLFLAVFSCTKTNNNDSTTTAVKPSLNQLFAALRYTPQSLSVTAGRDTVVYGTSGTRFHFYTHSFKDGNGNILNSGTVYLQLIEMYGAGDMICNRVTTFANDQILMSGGEVAITAALADGIPVFANKYGISFKQTASSSVPMQLFYGNTANADSVTNWAQSDTSHGAMATGTIVDTAYTGGGVSSTPLYIFDSCSNISWINCDWFWNDDSPKTTVSIVLPDTSFNQNNTEMYLILPNPGSGSSSGSFKAVLSSVESGGSSYTKATNTLMLKSEGSTAIVPAGKNYQLVVIANKNNQFYYFSQSGTIPHNGLVANATMVIEVQSALVAQLKAL